MDQLLIQIINIDRPELELKRRELEIQVHSLKQIFNDNNTIIELEDKILWNIQDNAASILVIS